MLQHRDTQNKAAWQLVPMAVLSCLQPWFSHGLGLDSKGISNVHLLAYLKVFFLTGYWREVGQMLVTRGDRDLHISQIDK